MKFDEIAGKSPASARECAAEFLGTFLLVFTVGCNVVAGGTSWAVLSIAALLAVMVYALAPISGANLNPAVSVALSVAGKMSWAKVGVYAAVQIVAGLAAGFGYRFLLGEAFSLHPTTGHVLWQAAIAEIIYTFMLCTVVLNVAASKMHGGSNEFFGLAIGGVIVAGGYSGGSISMGCFNPAVAVGIGLSGGGGLYSFAYAIFEIIGATFAALLFKFCRPEDYDGGPSGDSIAYPMQAKLIAEAVGTFILSVTAGLDVAASTKAAAVSIAAALTCMIFALGSISGGHFNPAVTLALHINGDKGVYSGWDVLKYMGTQIGAAVVAMIVGLLMHGESFGLGPVAPHSWAQALVCETVFTFLLVSAVLSATSQASSLGQITALAVGLTVVCGGLASGFISGGVLNPAVASGVAVVHSFREGGRWALLALVPYFLAELFGGVLAAVAFKFVRPNEAPPHREKLSSSWLPFYGSSSS